MSRVVAAPNASKGAASGRLTPGVARSLGSDGSDGDRNTTPGVSPFGVPIMMTLFLLPALALAALPPAGLAEQRRVERYAGDVAEAAAVLGATAAEVHAAGRLQSLQRLRDRLGDLDRSILDLERSLAALEAALEASEPVPVP
jgi:hypothetical protein